LKKETRDQIDQLSAELTIEKNKTKEAKLRIVTVVTEKETECERLQRKVSNLEQEVKDSQMRIDAMAQRMNSFDLRESELFLQIRMQDEVRRQLHNKVMQLSGNMRVFVRVRPPLPTEIQGQNGIQKSNTPFSFPALRDREVSMTPELSSNFADDLTKNLIIVTEPYKDRGGLNPRQKKWRFAFDHAFPPEKSQDDVWSAAEPLVQSAVDGFNVCIFAYGQTGVSIFFLSTQY